MASVDEEASAAAARACVDVLRGARVLVKQNRAFIMKLMRAELSESKQEVVETVQGFAAELSDMLTETSGSLNKENGVSVGAAAVKKVQLGAPFSTTEEGRTVQRPWGRGLQEPVNASVSSGVITGGAATCVSGKPVVGQSGRAFKFSARAEVLATPELLRHIMAMLIEGQRTADCVAQLDRLSPVCRLWRDIASCQGWWERIAKNVVPVLGVQGACVTQDMLAKAGGSYRDFMVQLGRRVVGMNRVIIESGQHWARHLRLLIGVWHPLYRTYILDGECDLCLQEQDIGPTLVRPCYHVRSHEPAFTAGRFGAGDVAAIFEDEDNSLRTRVVLLDPLSNRSAVLFDDRYLVGSNGVRFSDDDTTVTVTTAPVTVSCVAYGQSEFDVRVRYQVRLEEDMDDAGRTFPEENVVWKADMEMFEMMWSDADGEGLSKADLARFMYAALGL